MNADLYVTASQLLPGRQFCVEELRLASTVKISKRVHGHRPVASRTLGTGGEYIVEL